MGACRGRLPEETRAVDACARAVGGSWLGFEFRSPQKVAHVALAQGADDFPGLNGVEEVFLEAEVGEGALQWAVVGRLKVAQPSQEPPAG